MIIKCGPFSLIKPAKCDPQYSIVIPNTFLVWQYMNDCVTSILQSECAVMKWLEVLGYGAKGSSFEYPTGQLSLNPAQCIKKG